MKEFILTADLNWEHVGYFEHLELRKAKETGGLGLFASIDFKPNQKICSFSAREVVQTPNYLTVQLDDQRHILLFPEHLQYINHSCAPTVFFDTEHMELISLDHLVAGTELTFFYPSTEWDMNQSFVCNCGAEKCQKFISGAAGLDRNILKEYKLNPFIKNKLGEL